MYIIRRQLKCRCDVALGCFNALRFCPDGYLIIGVPPCGGCMQFHRVGYFGGQNILLFDLYWRSLVAVFLAPDVILAVIWQEAIGEVSLKICLMQGLFISCCNQ